jgi:hypothetical protein
MQSRVLPHYWVSLYLDNKMKESKKSANPTNCTKKDRILMCCSIVFGLVGIIAILREIELPP